jgi:hypothetical protein
MTISALKDLQGRQFILQLLVVWLGCLSHIASAQVKLSEKISGSVNFPNLVITCIGNLAIFITKKILESRIKP